METTPYKKIIRRDVNNYIAIKQDGKVKLKGIFELEKELHKDFSFQIIPIALYNYFVNNISINKTFEEQTNIFDYLGSVRTRPTKTGNWKLYFTYIKNNKIEKELLQKINRYYVTNNKNKNIVKMLPNDNSNWKHVEAGYNLMPINVVEDTNAKNYDINYSFYRRKINEIINKIEDKQLKLF